LLNQPTNKSRQWECTADFADVTEALLKDIFVALTISIDQTRRALVIDFPCYGVLEIVSIIARVVIMIIINHLASQ